MRNGEEDKWKSGSWIFICRIPMHRGQNIQDKEWFQIIMMWVGVESPNYSLEQCRTPWTLGSAPFLCCEDSKGAQASPTHPCLRVESFWTKRTPHPSQQWLPQNLESCASCIYQTLKLEVCQVYWSCRTWVPTGLPSLHEQLCLTYRIHLFPLFLNNSKKVTGKYRVILKTISL